MHWLSVLNTGILPGHSLLLHSSNSLAEPEQTFPSWAGVGLSQGLFLLRLPPPHDTEQDDQAVHSPHPPFIALVVVSPFKFVLYNKNVDRIKQC